MTFRKQVDLLLDRLKNPQAQLAIIIAMIAYFVILLSWQHNYTHYADQIPPLLEVPAKVEQLASKVTVGLHVNNFSEFSFSKNKFTMDALVWFSFPLGTESLQTIKQFGFQNGKIKRKSLPTIKIVDNIVMVSFQTVVDFKAHLDYTYFPMSDHRLTIVLENRSVTPNELCLDSTTDHFALSDDLLTATWVPRNKIVKKGYVKALLHEQDDSLEVSYPCVSFTLEFTNESIRDLMSLYFPLFILFFIGFFTLMIDIGRDVLRTSILATSLPTMAMFRLVIDNVAPPASKITRIDYLYYLLVVISLVLVLFQVYALLVHRRVQNKTELMKSDARRLLEFLNAVLFGLVTVALVWAVTYIHLF
ncbi:MAG: hypothetical protein PVJ92_01555 [Candidatus Dependentiae bacterium]|jgi:hypothetical protein